MRLIRLLKNDIAKEADEWVSEDIITQFQAERICQRYGIDFHQEKRRSQGYNVLIGLGYLFIGLAIITLLGANWDDIPRAIRMWGLITLTMVTQGVALRKHMKGDKHGAAGFFLLGNLFYGASIILIAQIYHLGEHMPDGIFWWALGCMPIAVLINNPWVTLQAALLALIWFLLEVSMGFYPMLFPLFILGSLIVLFRGKQNILLFLTVTASIGFWAEYSFAEYWSEGRHLSAHAEHVAVSISMFIMAYVFSHWLDQKESVTAKDYGAVLAFWSLRFGLIFMLVMSFKAPWSEFIDAEWAHIPSMFVFVILMSIGSLFLAYRVGTLPLVTYIISFFLLSLIAVLLSGNEDHAIYFQIAYNIVLIATGIWLIMKGIQDGISHYFFLGIAAILLTALMRYIDLIGDYIGGAALFMVFAIVLISAAKFWKRHQLREAQA